MLGVTKDKVPVPFVKTDPPVDAAYQSKVAPDEAVPDKVTVPVPVREPSVIDVTVGRAFTVADPVATFWVVAGDDTAVTFPPFPFVALAVNLM